MFLGSIITFLWFSYGFPQLSHHSYHGSMDRRFSSRRVCAGRRALSDGLEDGSGGLAPGLGEHGGADGWPTRYQ